MIFTESKVTHVPELFFEASAELSVLLLSTKTLQNIERTQKVISHLCYCYYYRERQFLFKEQLIRSGKIWTNLKLPHQKSNKSSIGTALDSKHAVDDLEILCSCQILLCRGVKKKYSVKQHSFYIFQVMIIMLKLIH